MSRNESKPIDRCAEILLALINGVPDHRLSEQEQQLRREEVNVLLNRMDDRTIVDTLNKLYRIAERDAQRRAHGLAAAIAESHCSRWFAAFRRKRS